MDLFQISDWSTAGAGWVMRNFPQYWYLGVLVLNGATVVALHFYSAWCQKGISKSKFDLRKKVFFPLLIIFCGFEWCSFYWAYQHSQEVQIFFRDNEPKLKIDKKAKTLTAIYKVQANNKCPNSKYATLLIGGSDENGKPIVLRLPNTWKIPPKIFVNPSNREQLVDEETIELKPGKAVFFDIGIEFTIDDMGKPSSFDNIKALDEFIQIPITLKVDQNDYFHLNSKVPIRIPIERALGIIK